MGDTERVTIRRFGEAEMHLLRPHVERFMEAQRGLTLAVRSLAPREMQVGGATFDPVRYEISCVPSREDAIPSRVPASTNGGP